MQPPKILELPMMTRELSTTVLPTTTRLFFLIGLFLFNLCGVSHASEKEHPIIASEYQQGKQEIRVLLPDTYNTDKKYSVLYVLPPAPNIKHYTEGFDVLKKMGAHNTYDVIVVTMSLERGGWFGDHPTDKKYRNASYIKDFVVPYIESKYSTLGTAEGRMLLGFSKTGWGAYSMILKNPEFYGYAAAWDAPITFKTWTQPSSKQPSKTYTYKGMKSNFETQEQLDLFRPDLLIEKNKKHFQDKVRLVLLGNSLWGKETVETHLLLEEARIKHVYNNTIKCGHRWDKSWLEPALNALIRARDGTTLDSSLSTPDMLFAHIPPKPEKKALIFKSSVDLAAVSGAASELKHDMVPSNWVVSGPHSIKADYLDSVNEESLSINDDTSIGSLKFEALSEKFLISKNSISVDAIDRLGAAQGKGNTACYFYTVLKNTLSDFYELQIAGKNLEIWLNGVKLKNGQVVHLPVGSYSLLVKSTIPRLPPFMRNKVIAMKPRFIVTQDPAQRYDDWIDGIRRRKYFFKSIIDENPTSKWASKAKHYLKYLENAE